MYFYVNAQVIYICMLVIKLCTCWRLPSLWFEQTFDIVHCINIALPKIIS